MRNKMKRLLLSSTTKDLLVVTLFGLIMTTPLWSATTVPCTHDGHLHYHRIAALNHAWENGLLFTRWLPDLAFGYGYPFFIYREAPPLLIPYVFHLLGVPLPGAENMAYALWLLLAGWFMYLWVRDIFGRHAAIVSAVAYMTAPYLLIDTLIRGNSPESLALPLLPLILWSSRRYLIADKSQFSLHRSAFIPYFLLSVFSLALLSLSHNISIFIFAPTLLVYLSAIALIHKLRLRSAGARIGLLFLLGLGMTIFYTGGALLELSQVTLEQSTNSRNNDFHYNFAALGEIFAPVTPDDPNLVNPPLLFRLGWVPVGLVLIGVVIWLMRSVKARRTAGAAHPYTVEQSGHIVMMLVAAAVYLLLALPVSLLFWETVPLIDFVQFPWRFIGRMALPIAMLSGILFVPAIGKTALIRAMYYGALVLLVLEALPLLYPSMCVEKPFPTINDVHAYEAQTGLVGVDPEGSYFPRTVQQRPDSSPLLADYQVGRTPQRFDATAFPPETTVNGVSYGNNWGEINLTTPQAFTLRYLTFDFPGWTATVDGVPVSITSTVPEGLIAFEVPAGEHTIAVRWQTMPTRTILTVLSVTTLAGVVVVAVWAARSKGNGRRGEEERQERVWHREYLVLVLVALGLLGFKLLVVDRTETVFGRSGTPQLDQPANIHANEMRFEGHNLSRDDVPGGATFDIDMAWTAVTPPTARYQSNVWLADADGLVWSDTDTQRPRVYEDAPLTQTWQPGQWGWDSREVAVLSGTPPGTYDLVLTYFDFDTLQPLTLMDGATGTALGPTVVIDQIEVTEGSDSAEFSPQFPLDALIGSRQLLGINQDRNEATPGDQVLLTLFWEQLDADDTTISLRLTDEAGETAHVWELPATSLPAGMRWRDQQLLRLPGSLDSGTYRLALDDVALSEISITAPERIFEQPGVGALQDTPFFLPDGSPAGTLVSVDTGECHSAELTACVVQLVWRADAEVATSYRVFVHLIDENGTILAQSDGEPANWNRPMTGWMPGEYIFDPHLLPLSADASAKPFALRIGLYDPQVGTRLSADAGDFVTIPLEP